MALQGSDLAILTARFGCARFGASRFGFIPCPEDVHGLGAEEPGEYIWKEVKPPTTAWTLQTEDCICGQRQTTAFAPMTCSLLGGLVTFTDLSTPLEDIESWYWDFGDGSTSTAQNPTHTYAAEGYYTVTLYTSGPKGTTSATGHVSVISTSAAADPGTVEINIEVTFTPTVNGGLAPYTYLWDFDDGNDSTDETPTHSWEAAGVKTVTLTVTDANGCSASDTVDVTVTEIEFSVTVTANQNEGGLDGEAIIQFHYFITGGTAPYTYSLEWTGGGGGGPETAEDPVVTFTGGVPGEPDTIPYTLTVTDDTLATAQYSDSVNITYWDAP